MVIESGVKAAAAEARAKAELERLQREDEGNLDSESFGKGGEWTNPFLRVNCMVNTAFLWGRGIVSVSVGENCAMCIDKYGQIFAWGGNDKCTKTPTHTHIYIYHRYAITQQQQQKKDAFNPPLTARSRKMMNVMGKRPELVNQNDLGDEFDEEKSKEKLRQKKERELGDNMKEVFKYFNVWTPPPSNRLRMKHMQLGLLPKITHTELKTSLELRKKSCENKTKIQLVEMLAKDLIFENKSGVQSKNLRKMEIELSKAVLSNNVFKKMEVKNAFEEIWNEDNLLSKQREEDSDTKKRNLALRAARMHQDEAEYKQWRDQVLSLLDSHEKTYTPRGRNLRITLSGFTARGPKPEPGNAASSVRLVDVGAHHAGVIHKDGSVYVYDDGARSARTSLSLSLLQQTNTHTHTQLTLTTTTT